jgi:cytochrome P450
MLPLEQTLFYHLQKVPIVSSSDIATPQTKPSGLSGFLGNPSVLALAARAFAIFSRWWQKPLRIGDKVIVGRHCDAVDVLSRDLEFRIGPINAEKIGAVNGPFILGMDRCATLIEERAALYRALSKVDLSQIRRQIGDEATRRVSAAGDQIDVVADYARPIAAATAQTIFGIKGSDDTTFMNVARAIFAHVFLNIGNDKAVEARAILAAPFLHDWLKKEIAARRASGEPGTDLMGALLADAEISNDDAGNELIRRTLGGMLVGSIDTTATCVAKIVTVIGQDKALAAGIAADVDDFARLHGWCWEALRRWPHNPILLRSAAIETDIAGVDVHVNDQVFIYTQAAMLDTAVFPDPQVLNPARPTGPYLHFGGGLHPCAGRDINAFQIPLLVGALVRRGIKSVGTIGWAGPFPDHLVITFDRMAR